VRDGFVIREQDYYKTVWTTFMTNAQASRDIPVAPFSDVQSPISDQHIPCAEVLVAEVDGEPVAAIFIFYFAGRAYYVYGMSRDKHREKMPTYLLQWEAMRRAKAKGCTVYDLWGAPEDFNESDSMWGVYRFKEGLGGKVVRTIGAWDFAPNPLWYKMYSQIIPRMLDVMRSRGRAKTKQDLGA
jgi:lipid II:glycine glycyltransferase (peptidoglycan interpeptide bridge formation enzyme)